MVPDVAGGRGRAGAGGGGGGAAGAWADEAMTGHSHDTRMNAANGDPRLT